MVQTALMRNFSIIAHIDHGKSTLSDRLIQYCGGLSEREMQSQVLDNMDIERERGITIKSQSVRLMYNADDGQTYQLNLIDTPGHVDFSYEVSRSLAACEGALLVVDAGQGVEAQTVANTYTAIAQDLTIVPVVNKIDLPQAQPEVVMEELENIIGIDASGAALVSAKTGVGIKALLEQIIAEIPPPKGDAQNELQALIIDSWFDNYLGVISLVRIFNGQIHKGDKIYIKSTQTKHSVEGLRVATPKYQQLDQLSAGEVGMISASIKDIQGAPVGDTITLASMVEIPSLPGFKKIKPQIYAAIFPTDSDQYEDFRESLAKLVINDAALEYEPETSDALGFGFRIGFLGLLHMEIVQERLEREYNLDLITTPPTVRYKIDTKKGETIFISNPSDLPPPNVIETIFEPIAEVNILVPQEYLGNVITLSVEKRGVQKSMDFVGKQVSLRYLIPMAEVILDFFDTLKSVSRGYASLDYQFYEFQQSQLVKVDILINGDKVDALSIITHHQDKEYKGRAIAEKMQKIIPRQMFDVAIQAAIGGHIIARTTVKALRKNVTAKCYGGDVSRKRKLLEKQKAGKKRMKQIGKVSIPQDAFMAVLRSD